MRAGSFCSGIGAPEIGMPRWHWRWCAEIDKQASAVHAARHGVTNLGDMTADDFAERAAALGPVDIIVAGTPCQSFSIAGKRLGLGDPRGNLTLRAIALARELGADWLVLENVPGLLSDDGGRSFEAVLGAMAECGYHVAWRVLDAQYAGLAQRRERVFIVGHLGGWAGPAAVLFERESLHGHPAPRREAESEYSVTVIKGAAIGREPENGPQFGEFLTDGSVYTLLACERHAVIVHDGVRYFTPVEIERLQGFADDFTLLSCRGKPMGDGARCRMVGNSMAVPVIRWVLSRVEAVHAVMAERAAVA